MQMNELFTMAINCKTLWLKRRSNGYHSENLHCVSRIHKKLDVQMKFNMLSGQNPRRYSASLPDSGWLAIMTASPKELLYGCFRFYMTELSYALLKPHFIGNTMSVDAERCESFESYEEIGNSLYGLALQKR